ncbi:MAG: porin family protein [Acidobacteria bacterium]|nr:porin family protein [Acidobacteriota bacterium]
MSALLTTGVLACGTVADAQVWTGPYVGGSAGGSLQREDGRETVGFDTNLDGNFTDEVRTIAGANAFSTGFCGGLAVNAMASSGCTEDENGIDFGGRVGYDWQFGRLVVGGVVDAAAMDVIDSATAFSTTPAFYSFTRELKVTTGLRGRVGVGSGRVLLYGTGGAAWGNVEETFTTSNAVNTFTNTRDGNDSSDNSNNVWGYQAGGGIEYRFAGNWSLAGEYLFTDLDNRESSTVRVQGPAPATNPFILVNASGTDMRRADTLQVHGVRFGVNYRF